MHSDVVLICVMPPCRGPAQPLGARASGKPATAGARNQTRSYRRLGFLPVAHMRDDDAMCPRVQCLQNGGRIVLVGAHSTRSCPKCAARTQLSSASRPNGACSAFSTSASSAECASTSTTCGCGVDPGCADKAFAIAEFPQEVGHAAMLGMAFGREPGAVAQCLEFRPDDILARLRRTRPRWKKPQWFGNDPFGAEQVDELESVDRPLPGDVRRSSSSCRCSRE